MARGTFERMLPSPLTILAVVVIAFFVVLGVVRGPVDADFWWHLTTGRLIVEQGAVPAVDPFSFAYDGTWVAHEWLGEVVIHAVVSSVGYPVTAAIFGMAAAGALLIPATVLHRQGVGVRALLPFIAIGTFTFASFVTVRPQVLSWLLLAGLLSLLISLRSEHRHRPALVVPLFVLWANLHGLYVVGLGALALYVVFTLIGRTPLAPRRWTAVGMLAGSVIAAALTPAGPAGLLYPLRYLRTDDWGTSFIAEWQPADFTDPRQWGLIVLIVAAVALGRRGSSAWLAATAVVGIIAGILAVRNQPLTTIMTLPMLAMALQARLGAAPSRPDAGRRRLLEMGLAAIIIAAMLVILPRVATGSEQRAFPVAAFDRLVEEGPTMRALVDYDWGGYAIHRLHPSGGSVFIDGRSDMYPREIFEDYLSLRMAEPGWEDLLSEYGVEAILLPPSAPLIEVAQQSGWCADHGDQRAVLLTRCPREGTRLGQRGV